MNERLIRAFYNDSIAFIATLMSFDTAVACKSISAQILESLVRHLRSKFIQAFPNDFDRLATPPKRDVQPRWPHEFFTVSSLATSVCSQLSIHERTDRQHCRIVTYHEAWHSQRSSRGTSAAPTRRIPRGSLPSSLAPLAMRGAE